MNSIGFEFSESKDSNDHQIRVMVDGQDLLSRFGRESLGIDPPGFFRQSSLLSGGELLVGRCTCGVVGCDDTFAYVVRRRSSVSWQFGSGQKLEFELGQYRKVVDAACSNKEWESVQRTAERLVSALDFSTWEEGGCSFEWASARITRGRITLSFSKGNAQHLFQVGWNDSDPTDAVQRVESWLLERPRI